MLDRKHPMTGHVFRVSGLMDNLKARGQQMSVSPSAVRAELLVECLPLFAEMRKLAEAHFDRRIRFIAAAVDEYESAIRALAGLGNGRITGDQRDGIGLCPACGTQITHNPKYKIVLCAECAKPFMLADAKLDSSDGFGTWAI
jgi:hypothetical protein